MVVVLNGVHNVSYGIETAAASQAATGGKNEEVPRRGRCGEL
ncbi:MAG: hypothetical protein WD738_17490 [Pirellulales bacterium]